MTHNPHWVAFGDIHEDLSGLQSVPELRTAEAVLITGDLTNHGNSQRAEDIISRIQKINTSVFAQIGNMDTRQVEQYLETNNMNVHSGARDLGHGVWLIGVGYSTPTPFNTPSEVDDGQIRTWLKQAMEKAGNYDHLILMAHDPPHGTKADKLGSGDSVGSKAVREFIEEHQPDVCLTGHIHESVAEDKVGRTTVINPGMFGAGGYVLVELSAHGLKAKLKKVS